MFNVNAYSKMIPTTYIDVNNISFRAGDLLLAIDELEDTSDIGCGEYAIKDYEVSDIKTMDKLVEMGVAKTFTGSRMAKLYCVNDEAALNELRSLCEEALDNFEEKGE